MGGWRSITQLTALMLGWVIATTANAQNVGVTLSQVLILDSERAYLSSAAGQKITDDLEARLAELAAENRRIETELEAEELDLTQKRSEMEAVDFRVLAVGFDEKVQKIRAEQDAKQLELQRLREQDRQSFIESMSPVISRIARERGAVVILERRSVLLSADTVDITEEVIARINAARGNNAQPPQENDPSESQPNSVDGQNTSDE